MTYVQSLDEALRSTTMESEQGQNLKENSSQISTASSEAPLPASHDITPSVYRPSTLITVHRKPYLPSMSETSSDEDSYDIDNSPPTPSTTQAVVIGNYVNVGTTLYKLFRPVLMLHRVIERLNR